MKKILYSFLILFLLATQGCVSDKEPEGPSLKVGDSLPVFTIEMNDGSLVTTQSLRGQIPLIVFFNTNCQDCQTELTVIQKLWDHYHNTPTDVGDSQKVRILTISREESAEDIIDYWQLHGFTLPFSAQETRQIYSLFAQSVIPRIYIADANGVISAMYGDKDMPDLDTLISDIDFANSRK